MSTPAKKESAFVALQYRDFRYFWAGNIISQTGGKMQAAAISLHIWRMTQDELAIGFLGLANILPILIFAIWGGLFADSRDRKKVIIIAEATMMIGAAVLAFSTYSGIVTPLIIYLMSAVNAIGVSFGSPARTAMVPRLVPEKHLPNAISLNMMMFQVSLMAGPLLGGLVYGIAGPGTVYFLNALTFMAMIFNVLQIKTSGQVPVRMESGLSAIRDGFRYVYKTPLIWSTMVLDFWATFLASALLLLPVYVDEILHVGEIEYGVLAASPAVGSFITAYILARIGNFGRQGVILLWSIAIFGVATIVFGITTNFWVAFIALAVTGASDTVSAMIRNLIRQLKTPDEMRGRMTGINMMFYMGGPQLGEFEAGWLAARTSTPFSVVFGGVATIIMIGVAAVTMPFLRRFDNFEVKGVDEDEAVIAAIPASPVPQPASD